MARDARILAERAEGLDQLVARESVRRPTYLSNRPDTRLSHCISMVYALKTGRVFPSPRERQDNQ